MKKGEMEKTTTMKKGEMEKMLLGDFSFFKVDTGGHLMSTCCQPFSPRSIFQSYKLLWHKDLSEEEEKIQKNDIF